MGPEETLRIEITTGHCLGGEGNDVYPGQILTAPKDLSMIEARKKVQLGYARLISSAPPAGSEGREASGPAIVTHRDPSPESRDPIIQAPERTHRRRFRTGRRNTE